MSKYIVTITDRYEVEADSPEQALASYRVSFDGIEPEILEIAPEDVIDSDDFEYLDGSGTAEEAEYVSD